MSTQVKKGGCGLYRSDGQDASSSSFAAFYWKSGVFRGFAVFHSVFLQWILPQSFLYERRLVMEYKLCFSESDKLILGRSEVAAHVLSRLLLQSSPPSARGDFRGLSLAPMTPDNLSFSTGVLFDLSWFFWYVIVGTPLHFIEKALRRPLWLPWLHT